jgi:hypothetical protein
LICVVYLHLAVYIDRVFFTLRIYLAVALLGYSMLAFIAKLVLTTLIVTKVINQPDYIVQSLGIIVDLKNIRALNVLGTYT